jgi:hypothetical protein
MKTFNIYRKGCGRKAPALVIKAATKEEALGLAAVLIASQEVCNLEAVEAKPKRPSGRTSRGKP